MKKTRISFTPCFERSPVSFWVHKYIDGEAWSTATKFDPPLPRPTPGKGWARAEVEFDGFLLEFASINELDHVIDVLGRNPLPTTRQLSDEWGTGAGPNGHWLSRFPSKLKSQKHRARLVSYLKTVRIELIQATG